MTMNPWTRWSGTVMTVALLLMFTTAGALAAIPSTADYRNATRPMVTGTALLVNQHQLLVDTEQGEEVLLTLDSRTLLPTDLAPGMMMRVEFNYLNDGTRYATRVIPIRRGQKTTRELAYSNEREELQYAREGEAVEPDDPMARPAVYRENGTMNADGGYRTHDGYRTADGQYHKGRVRMMNAATVTNQPMGTPLRPIPATYAYVLATEPMIHGRVVAVNDHRMVVDTDQGHHVMLEMDTRTLVPTTLQSGMGVRVEYKALENGTKLATRVVPADLDEEYTGAEGTFPEGQVPANYEGDLSTASNQTTTDVETTDEPVAANQTGEPDRSDLPQTTSPLPIIGLLGLLALGSGAFLARRRFRNG